MSNQSDKIILHVISKINEVSADSWDACAGSSNPFVSHAFLSALEESGSVTNETGWMPQHLIAKGKKDDVVACMPMYLKNHSYGEYIFDWGWADAFNRAGGQYYPKLQVAIPFTPVTGPRMLVRKGDPETYQRILINGMLKLVEKHNVSSLHITFPEKKEWDTLGNAGFIQRTSKQFHWQNQGYKSFEQFLDKLASRKRKAIKKERREIQKQGVSLKRITGSDIKEHHWDEFYRYYLDTIDRKWGQSYLTRDFFSILGERMPQQALLVTAEYSGKNIAGALNLIGKDTIFGRNWGCIQDFKFLHFEACYYQAIDFAIERNLKWVEAGAQGPHKIQRGYLPREVYSAHWITNPSFREAVQKFIENERREVDYEINKLMEFSPYREKIKG